MGAVQLHRRNMLVNRYGHGDCANLTMEFLSDGISFTKEITRLGPILSALAERGFDWRFLARDVPWKEMIRDTRWTEVKLSDSN